MYIDHSYRRAQTFEGMRVLPRLAKNLSHSRGPIVVDVRGHLRSGNSSLFCSARFWTDGQQAEDPVGDPKRTAAKNKLKRGVTYQILEFFIIRSQIESSTVLDSRNV